MTLINKALLSGLVAIFVSPVFWKVYEHYYRWIFPDTNMDAFEIGISAACIAMLAAFMPLISEEFRVKS